MTKTVALPELRPGYAEFVAVYPYDPGAPAITASRPRATGGETVEFTLRMTGVPPNETGPFSYQTRMLDPSGKWVDIIPWSVQGIRGNAVVRVRFAYSDPAGKWTLQVREVTTGRTATAVVEKW